MQGAEKISPRAYVDMYARNFFRNAAVGMKSEFIEVPYRWHSMKTPE